MHIHSQIVSPSEANLKGCNVVLTFESVYEKSQYSVPMQVKVFSGTFIWCWLLWCKRWGFEFVDKIKSVNIQMNVTEYFHVVLLLCCVKVSSTFESVKHEWNSEAHVTIKLKSFEQAMVWGAACTFYKEALTCEYVVQIQTCEHWNKGSV